MSNRPNLAPWEVGQTASAGEAKMIPNVTCAISILYILIWHGTRNTGVPSSLLAMGEVLSYCCHACLAFVTFFVVAQQFENLSAPQFYVKTVIRMYPLHLLALALFLALTIVNTKEFLSGAALMDGIQGNGLLTLWFSTTLLLLYLVTPVVLSGYSDIRLFAVMAGIFVVGGLLKVKFHLVDLRLFQFLIIFAIAVWLARGRSRANWWQTPIFLCAAAVVFALAFVLAARYEKSAGRFELFCLIAMCAFIPLLIKFANVVGRYVNNRLAAALGFVWFAAFLSHRIVFAGVTKLVHPTSDAMLTWTILGLGVPLTLLAAYAVQSSFNRLFAYSK